MLDCLNAKVLTLRLSVINARAEQLYQRVR